MMEVKPVEIKSRRKSGKKRSAKDPSFSQEGNATYHAETGEAPEEFDMNEPTMGEKLEKLRLLEDAGTNALEKEPPPEIPSVDSVHILLKQALNAEDHVLLSNCLNTREEKVISNSVAQLSPADVLRLLNSLVSITHARGSALVCAIPWLRSLLIHHASGIMAQESSLAILNSLYQVIESRTSTLTSALQLSTSIDFLFSDVIIFLSPTSTPDPILFNVHTGFMFRLQVLSDEMEEGSGPPPLIFEDKDSDDDDGEEDSDGGDMGSDEEEQQELIDMTASLYDSGDSDVMSQ